MDIPVISATRRNHAFEHATVAMLIQRLGTTIRLAGRSTANGFFLYGNLPTETVRSAAEEALARLKAGEADLAVTPQCGTNLAVSGILAAVVSTAAMGNQRRAERLPTAILYSTLAVLAAQPIGRLVQKYVTTCPDVQRLRIARITASGSGPLTVHTVETAVD